MKERQDLKKRTREFALRVIRLFAALPGSVEAQVLGKQVLRSGTSVGAQYRESVRAKSDADFVSKIEGALQELEETQYWLELIGDAEIISVQRLTPLIQEAEELTAIFVSMVKAVKNEPTSRH
ncbi:MAG TPA: four helix bundle protein [Acidobacteriota bacterium]|nr:four helix bundle protein [Acidobacteriota bacterium]HNC44655.1 four helix bundle protein [Acidobacteriota bacterium]